MLRLLLYLLFGIKIVLCILCSTERNETIRCDEDFDNCSWIFTNLSSPATFCYSAEIIEFCDVSSWSVVQCGMEYDEICCLRIKEESNRRTKRELTKTMIENCWKISLNGSQAIADCLNPELKKIDEENTKNMEKLRTANEKLKTANEEMKQNLSRSETGEKATKEEDDLKQKNEDQGFIILLQFIVIGCLLALLILLVILMLICILSRKSRTKKSSRPATNTSSKSETNVNKKPDDKAPTASKTKNRSLDKKKAKVVLQEK